MLRSEFNERCRQDDYHLSIKKFLSSNARENEENTSKDHVDLEFRLTIITLSCFHQGIRGRIITSNMTSLRRQFTSFLFALALALQCLALEDEIGKIQLSFSIWSPDSMDFDIVEKIVTNALRDFFCEETDMVLLDSNFRSACIRRSNNGKESAMSEEDEMIMMGFIQQSDPDRSYLLDDPSIVRMSFPEKRDVDLKGTLWLTDYEILQIGTKAISRAKRENFPDEKAYLEQTVQESLDRSIAEGVLYERLGDTNTIIGEYRAQDIDANLETALSTNDHAKSALILRYVGIGLLLGTSFVHYLLFELESRYPRPQSKYTEVEIEDSAQHYDAECQRGLGTEEGVNQMLEEGRRQTEERIQSSSAHTV